MVPVLAIYPKELKSGSQRGICSLMSPAALFTRAKMWEESKMSLTDEQIKKMYVWNNEILFGLQKEGNPVYVTT